jgi:hypothetical protein
VYFAADPPPGGQGQAEGPPEAGLFLLSEEGRDLISNRLAVGSRQEDRCGSVHYDPNMGGALSPNLDKVNGGEYYER